jgi:hypothetical protein
LLHTRDGTIPYVQHNAALGEEVQKTHPRDKAQVRERQQFCCAVTEIT